MKKSNFRSFLLVISILIFSLTKCYSEIIVLSKCDHKEDEFLKNEYILNLNELLMTRNYVYNEKTYQKYRITDLSVKKSNTCLLYTSPSPRDATLSRMPSSA